jgi:Zn-dependent peptidase ImmA (M78 family)
MNKMKLLHKAKIKVLNRPVSVYYYDYVFYQGQQCQGLYEPNKRKISVAAKDRTELEIKQTLLHEIGHCIIHLTGLYNCQLSHDLEEAIVDNFAMAINEIWELEL